VDAAHPHRHEHAHEPHAGPEHAHAAAPGPATFTAGEARQARRLKMVLGLVGGFFVLELGGALWAESVVLQADAAHLLMDVLALGMSLFAMRLAVRRPTARFTFGLRRAEPVAAIFSALLVLATTAGIVVEGIEALGGQTPPRATVMLVVAVMAIFVNGLSAWLLHDSMGHGHAHDPDNPDDHDDHEHRVDPAGPPAEHKAHGHALNLRGAWLHLMGDTLGGVAALVAALIIRFGGSPKADPIASFAVAAILLFGSLRLLRDALLVLLEASPRHLPLATVRQLIVGFPGVVALHDLHVWTLGAGHDAVTVHVRADTLDPSFGQRLSERIRSVLGVEYVTVQVEVGDEVCRAPASVWLAGERGGDREPAP
jgi:cobalt-zinc-cadmium efflux system protein